MNHDRDTPDDFAPLERELRAQRPAPSADELDRVHHRAVTAAATPARSRRSIFAPARLALVATVSGLLLVGGSSASLAVSGLSGDGSAGKAQYIQSTTPSTTPPITPPVTTPEQGGVLPSEDTGTAPGCSTSSARASQTNCPEDDATSPSLDTDGVDPAADTGGNDPAQETRQVSAGGSDGRLPFTGLLALPLMLVGVLMLGAGFVLRRTADRGNHVA